MAPPPNDNRANAIDLGTTTFATDTQDLGGATAEVGESEYIARFVGDGFTGVTPRHTAWWRWTCPAAQTMARVTATFVSGSGSANITVYDPSAFDFVMTAGNNQAVFIPVPGTTYYIQVDNRNAVTPFVRQITVESTGTPPANDDYANAIDVDLSGDLGEIVGDTFGATLEAWEPEGYYSIGGNTVWYKFTIPPGVYAVHFRAFTTGFANFGDVSLALFDEAQNLLTGWYARVGWLCTPGQVYYLQVDLAASFSTTGFTLYWRTFTAPPANDNFANPVTIQTYGDDYSDEGDGSVFLDQFIGGLPDGSFPRQPWTNISNILATTEPDEPIPSSGPGDGPWTTVWFKWRAPRMVSNFDVSLRPSYQLAGGVPVLSSDIDYLIWDTVLAAYEGPPRGATFADLVEVASNDDASSLNSEINFTAEPGKTYYIQVTSYNAPTGDPANDSFYVGFISISIDGVARIGEWSIERVAFGGYTGPPFP